MTDTGYIWTQLALGTVERWTAWAVTSNISRQQQETTPRANSHTLPAGSMQTQLPKWPEQPILSMSALTWFHTISIQTVNRGSLEGVESQK